MPARTTDSRRTWLVAGAVLAAVAVLALILRSGGGPDHRLTLVLPQANFMSPGLKVRAAGVPVGEVVSADLTADKQARLGLKITDDKVWPLPTGTRARVRFGGTARFSDRYIDLIPAATGAPLADGAEIRATDANTPDDIVTTPTEFDELFGIFKAPTRRALKATLDAAGPALLQAAPPLQRSLDRAPAALDEASGVLSDLNDDPAALDTLVRTSDRVVQSIQASDPDVGRLVSAAGTTFSSLASEASNLKLAIERTPKTLTRARATMRNVDVTLAAASDLAKRLDPGVAQVKQIASPLRSTLDTVVDVGPDVRTTLSTVRKAIPNLDPFVTGAQRQMPAIGSIGRQADRLLECIRPYAPETMGFFQNWSSGFSRHPDGGDSYINAAVGTFPWVNGTPATTADLNRAFPAVTSPWLVPPGMIGGQPWWQPQCGSSPETSLDPTKDGDNMPLLKAKTSLGGLPKSAWSK